MGKLTTNRGFWLTLLLSIVTFGIYGFYLIYAFARETNLACAEDGKKTKGLLAYILLSIITFGIYGIVWNACLIGRRGSYLIRHGRPEVLSTGTYLLTVLLLGALTLGIMFLVVFCKYLKQQNEVNDVYNKLNNMG